MKAEDFKLSILDRAIEIVQKSENFHAYSCFAIEKAVKEVWQGSYWAGAEEQTNHSEFYSNFAENYFEEHPPTKTRVGDGMPPWWSTDYPGQRFIPERVAFMRIFREWLVDQGAS